MTDYFIFFLFRNFSNSPLNWMVDGRTQLHELGATAINSRQDVNVKVESFVSILDKVQPRAQEVNGS